MINKQIYITSLYKTIQKARILGKMNNIKLLLLFDLYKYYIDFAQNASDAGSSQFEDTIIYLKKELAKLQYKYPDIYCDYEVIINSSSTLVPLVSNTAPIVDSNTVDITTNTTYQFTVGDFTLNFADVDNNDYKYLLIYPLASATFGNLKTTNNTVEVTSPIVIDIEGLASSTNIDLYYNRTDFGAFGPDNFTFRVSDNAIDYLYSTLHTLGVSGTVSTENNQPPSDIGDNTLYVDNRAVTVFTLIDFTSGLTPPYNDPEADLIDAIRIIDISQANQGVFYFNGVPISIGQIITREDINAGLFTHEGADVDTITSDVFEFEARDEGSLEWVG